MEYRGGDQQIDIRDYTDNWNVDNDNVDNDNVDNDNGNNDPQAPPVAGNPAPLGGGLRCRRRAKTRRSKGRKTTRHKKH